MTYLALDANNENARGGEIVPPSQWNGRPFASGGMNDGVHDINEVLMAELYDIFPGLSNEQWDNINGVMNSLIDGLQNNGATIDQMRDALWAVFSHQYQNETGQSLALTQNASNEGTTDSDLFVHIASDLFDQNSLSDFFGDGAWVQAWSVYSNGQLLNEEIYIFHYGEYQPEQFVPIYTDATIDVI